MSTKKAVRFLKQVLVVCLVLFIIVGGLLAVQLIFEPFTDQIILVTDWIAKVNSVVETSLFTGISVGMIVLALVVAFLPLVSRKINRRQYLVATQRGVLAALVFFFSQMLYTWAENLSRFWLIVAIVGVAAITFILIETLSLLMRQDEEVAFRTDLLASIASGLVSGIVLKLIQVLVQGQS